ncbi:SDR family NAD(P)-dependent oxidoreductase [Streptomyces sp. NBC_01296]|uniref:SDR family NAD(P)-dependent oxidoreductase n=1 Tax=Streptomyces sp. NBC_01296 TaxID=2903816 RepID=UPI002E152BBA|nr:SDR family NAD(P)-dependent oxidoreductase [Streptomyces sp. NBC_01296]
MLSGDEARERDVAVVGMACRLPGGISSPAEFWSACLLGKDLVSEVPADRWDMDAVFDPEPGVTGRTVSRWGGFVDDVAGFDAEFFGIAPREAVWLDPQQRFLLEVGYEALEDAGLPLRRVAGSNSGVYVGACSSDYWALQSQDERRFSYYGMTGSWALSVLSGRLSHAFDLRGPSLTIDTACSSALAAVDAAVRHVRSGGSLALAAGVNLCLLPDPSIIYSGGKMLSREGRCKFGDASADGFVRSDAVGVVILKPLSDALADGDRIRAVIRGSAIGSDGHDGGLLVRPTVSGQSRVLEQAYQDADISPSEVDFVEAHGTGTQIGDPVELEALAAVLGPGRAQERRLLVTSAKTNLGHSEAAAGLVGLIKTVLCLEHNIVPGSLHFNEPNPAIPWDELPLRIPRTATSLPHRLGPSLGGVSSFGISGTNVHVVLAGAPQPAPRPGPPARAQLLTLSAAVEEALPDLAKTWAAFLGPADHPGAGEDRPSRPPRFIDICHSAARRRTTHPYRLALVAESGEEAAAALREHLAEDGPATSLMLGEARDVPQVAFVFPGHGSQWAGMGRDLLATESAFAEAFDTCDRAVQAESGVSLRSLIEEDDESWLSRTEIVQPALWAVQVALSALWRAWGVEPDVVIGHSMGEIAAACVAGALSTADAAAVICRRSRLATRLGGHGGMAWTELAVDVARQEIAPFNGSVAVAASNGPRSTLLSGETQAIRTIVASLEERGVAARPVNVAYASHCPQIDEITGDLLKAIEGISPRAAAVPIRSTLLGEVIDGTRMDAAYWARNIREPVEFSGAVRDQLASAHTIFVEISAHPVLTTAIREHGGAQAYGSLRRHGDARAALLETLGALYVAGVDADWDAVTDGGAYTPLPHYPWQHENFWLPPADQTEPDQIPVPRHPLLGNEVSRPQAGLRRWEGRLDLTTNAYLIDHQVQGAAIVPGTAYLELMAVAAGRILGPATPVEIDSLRVHKALFLSDVADVVDVRVSAQPDGDALRFEVHGRTAPTVSWTFHAEARVRGIAGPDEREQHAVDQALSRCPDRMAGEEFYTYRAARGNQWLGAFKAMEEVWRGAGEAVGRARLPEPVRASQSAHRFHPALLDACAQTIVALLPDTEESQDGAFVLSSIGAYRLYRQPKGTLWSHARLLSEQLDDSGSGSVRIYDSDGLVAELDGLRLRYLMRRAPAPVALPRTSSSPAVNEGPAGQGDAAPGSVTPQPRSSPRTAFSERETAVSIDRPSSGALEPDAENWLYTVDWVRSTPTSAPRPTEHTAHRWLILRDSGSVGRSLIAELRRHGDEVAVVTVAAAYQKSDQQHFQVDPTSPQDLATVVSDVCQKGSRLHGIVHLWSLDATRTDTPTDKELERAANLCCTSVANLVAALEKVRTTKPPRLWLVTRGAQQAVATDTVRALSQAPLWGLGPALAGESPRLRTTAIDLGEYDFGGVELARELLGSDDEDRIALRAGARYAARLRPLELPRPTVREALRLSQKRTGVLDELAFIPTTAPVPGPGQVLIRATHAGVTFREVLLATNAYAGTDRRAGALGGECSGTVAAVGPDVHHVKVGDDVVAFAEGALATHVLAAAELVVKRPSGLTPAEAAAMPVSFATAYHALHTLCGVTAGDRVLVHTASGGTGMAALQVARWLGARVYGTCSGEKRDALGKLGLLPEEIGDSRSLSFVGQFREATGGRGFDVILNTLTGEAVQANLSLLAPGGRYVELAKRDITDGTPIAMSALAENRSIHGVDLVPLGRDHHPALVEALRQTFDLYERGIFEPLPCKVFAADQVVDAFRHVARARHIGKVVIELPKTAPPAMTSPTVSGPQRLSQERAGVLDHLTFRPAEPPPSPGPGQVLVHATHAGLAFRDVLLATNAYPGTESRAHALGGECSGTVAAVGPDVHHVKAGDEVVAIAESALATHVLAAAELVMKRPSGLTPAEAAAVPLVFATAYHALHTLCGVSAGNRVLVHTASGGTGMAALQVARRLGAHVYGTCSEAKRDALAGLGLRPKEIGDSRSLSFVGQFREATGGQGFDVILNTLTGEAVQANLSLLAPGGRYVELAKRDITDGTPIAMSALAENRSIHGVDLIPLIRDHHPTLVEALRQTFDLYERGIFEPLPCKVFAADQVVDAFRHVARARHIGKVVIELPKTVPTKTTRPVPSVDGAQATCLVTGGLGGIGSRLVEHLAGRGPSHLLLLGRTPLPENPAAPGRQLLHDLHARGVKAEYHALDVADTSALTTLLAARRRAGSPPVRAMYHLAGVFEHGAVTDLTPHRLGEVLRPKVNGAFALHQALAGEPIERFVLFSSGSSVLSSPMGGAYAAGNAFLDALARHRRARGWPATLVNWGYWGDVGMVARERDTGRDLRPRGMSFFTPEEGLALLDTLLERDVPEAVVLRVDWPLWSATYPAAAGVPLLRDLVNGVAAPGSAEPADSDTGRSPRSPRHPDAAEARLAPDLAPPAALPTHAAARPEPAAEHSPAHSTPSTAKPAPSSAAGPVAQRDGAPADAVEEVLAQQVARVLGTRASRVKRDRPLTDLGIDSLMAVELRTLIELEFSASIRVVDILRGATLRSLADTVRATATSESHTDGEGKGRHR